MASISAFNLSISFFEKLLYSADKREHAQSVHPLAIRNSTEFVQLYLETKSAVSIKVGFLQHHIHQHLASCPQAFQHVFKYRDRHLEEEPLRLFNTYYVFHLRRLSQGSCSFGLPSSFARDVLCI